MEITVRERCIIVIFSLVKIMNPSGILELFKTIREEATLHGIQ